jgi:hypothetical protein
MKDEMRQEERIEALLDFLDGEAVIVDDETICFAHNIYLDGECLECGQPLQGVNL